MKQISCPKHEGSFLLYLNIGREKVEYMCDICYQELEYITPHLNPINIIHIKTLFQQPEHLISKLNIKSSLKQFFTFMEKFNDKTIVNIFDDFNNILKDLQKLLLKVQQELEYDSKNISEMKQKIRNQLNDVFKLDSFKQQILKLQQLEDSVNYSTIKENEQDLYQHLQDLTRNNSEELNKILMEILSGVKQQLSIENQQDYPQYKNLLKFIKLYDYEQLNFLNKIVLLQNEQKLLTLYSKQKLLNFIQHKQNYTKKISLQQIYLDTRDGLNIQTFWKKADKKKDLLMIFASKSGYIFGGYSPCLSDKSKGTYVADHQLSSFLFSETYDEIYPIKLGQRSNAIYCSESYGPIFGSGHDLFIGADFQTGSSIQKSYDFGNSQLETQIFGYSIPNIKEFEIFQVQFD
ncbi:unnamed protein product [Paramecium octaurelia]|uniref:TLDc domain-containing protein n=1 Tax=Paramecium octaurelia TaxID=43137 RepID=A0A8S1XUV6_PAROT|nr:unnamed protein product [Paramecium octaurelia]